MAETEGKKEMKLHLGCGEKYLEGYINVDYPQSEHTVMDVKADVYQDIRTLDYDENSIDEIRSHHLFEHFPRAEALKLLTAWRSWLKPGGKLVIETPDFEASARAYINAVTRKRKMELGRHIFGSQEAGWAVHYDFWDKSKFKYVLTKMGFKKIEAKRYSNSLAKHFPKIPLLNFAGNLLPNPFYKKYGGNKLPNIVVTAIRSKKEIDENQAVRDILNQYLVGKENGKMLNAWLNEFTGQG